MSCVQSETLSPFEAVWVKLMSVRCELLHVMQPVEHVVSIQVLSCSHARLLCQIRPDQLHSRDA